MYNVTVECIELVRAMTFTLLTTAARPTAIRTVFVVFVLAPNKYYNTHLPGFRVLLARGHRDPGAPEEQKQTGTKKRNKKNHLQVITSNSFHERCIFLEVVNSYLGIYFVVAVIVVVFVVCI